MTTFSRMKKLAGLRESFEDDVEFNVDANAPLSSILLSFSVMYTMYLPAKETHKVVDALNNNQSMRQLMAKTLSSDPRKLSQLGINGMYNVEEVKIGDLYEEDLTTAVQCIVNFSVGMDVDDFNSKVLPVIAQYSGGFRRNPIWKELQNGDYSVENIDSLKSALQSLFQFPSHYRDEGTKGSRKVMEAVYDCPNLTFSDITVNPDLRLFNISNSNRVQSFTSENVKHYPIQSLTLSGTEKTFGGKVFPFKKTVKAIEPLSKSYVGLFDLIPNGYMNAQSIGVDKIVQNYFASQETKKIKAALGSGNITSEMRFNNLSLK